MNAGVKLSDSILISIISLLNKNVVEYSRHLVQYFNLFHQYALRGFEERAQLIRLNVPELFILTVIDEVSGSSIKYQCNDLTKIYQVVSLLVRCYDVSLKCSSSHIDKEILDNPFKIYEDNKLAIPLQPKVNELLYNRGLYVKKLIEDFVINDDDTLKLLRFCCWENPHFSSMVLSEILWLIAYSYACNLKPYLDLLHHILIMKDSWQEHRIHNALRGNHWFYLYHYFSQLIFIFCFFFRNSRRPRWIT